MLGAGDLSAFAEHVGELREADIVTHTTSSSRASEQQRTDVAAASSVPAAAIVPDVVALEATQRDHVPTISTDVSKGGSGSRMVVGPDVTQVPVSDVVITDIAPGS
ncbi:hypothetical protein Q3G72_017473 [Acer saccharum]|nr:hypothetical protein Q3G72_017473 [Acer saccharum]